MPGKWRACKDVASNKRAQRMTKEQELAQVCSPQEVKVTIGTQITVGDILNEVIKCIYKPR